MPVILAYPLIASGLIASLLLGGLGMVNIDHYNQQIQQRQNQIKDDLEERFDVYEDWEDGYVQNQIDEWDGDEVTEDDLSEIQGEALEIYCFQQDIELTDREANYIRKQLPERLRDTTSPQHLLWYYFRKIKGETL